MLNLIYMLMDTEKNGAKIDIDLLNEYASKLENKTRELLDTLVKQYGERNYSSNQQVGEWLFEELGYKCKKFTPTGKYKVDEDILEELASVCEGAKLLLEYKKYAKALSTNILGLREVIWKDNKIHPNFNAHGTETGRLSSNAPNFQNWTRYDPKSYLGLLGVNLKNLVVCSDEDSVIVETDYSQAELRLIAEYSRDTSLYQAFVHERDPHAEFAVRLYHKELVADMEAGKISAKELYKKGIITKTQRTRAKTANFSLCYGKFPKNFSEEEGIPLNEAIEIHRIYWETYKGITEWKHTKLAEARTRGYFESFFGRRRRISNLNSDDEFLRGKAEREGINFIIQSQASDYTLYSTLKVLKRCKEVGIICKTISFVHDAAIYEVKKVHLQQFLTILQEIMTKVIGVSIPMEIECKVGNRLGSCKEWLCDNGTWIEKG